MAQDTSPLPLAVAGSLNDITPEWVESSRMLPLRVPKLQHVLQWLALLFDAHITSFHKQAGAMEVHCLLSLRCCELW